MLPRITPINQSRVASALVSPLTFSDYDITLMYAGSAPPPISSILTPLRGGALTSGMLRGHAWVWDRHAKESFKLFEDSVPELNTLREELIKQIEVKLGRKK